jgi:hypothetical protein
MSCLGRPPACGPARHDLICYPGRAVSGLPLKHGHNPIYKTRLEEGDGAMGLEDDAFQRVEGRRFFPWALLKKSRNDPDQNLFLRSDIF